MIEPVEKVGAEPKVTTNRAPEALIRPKYGVFGAQSGVEAGMEGVFQQAGEFCEVSLQHPAYPRSHRLGEQPIEPVRHWQLSTTSRGGA